MGRPRLVGSADTGRAVRSRLVNVPLALRRLAVASVLLVTACDLLGERRRESRFTDGRMLDDRVVAFTFHDEVVRPGRVDIALFRGRPSRQLRNVNGIGTYDLATGAVRVAWRRDHARSGWIGASCGIAEVRGSRVLAICGGQRADYRTDHEDVVVDLETGSVEVVPVGLELARNGFDGFFGRELLLDADAGLAILGHRSVRQSATDAPKDLLVRRPTGEYVHVGLASEVVAYRDGQLHFLSPEQRQLVFEVRTGRIAPARPEDAALRFQHAPRSAGDVSPTLDAEGSSRLRVRRTGSPRAETLPITVGDVADRRPQ